jgi:hypothetical protein
VAEAFPALTREAYLRAWLVINTRTFYYETPAMLGYAPEDRLALVPAADLFNHAAEAGCAVSFTEGEGYSVVTARGYRAGEEVTISYGRHSNDFLMGEYGFVMERNKWDRVGLDEVVLGRLGAEEKGWLREKGMLGPFWLGAEGRACWRTRAALGLLCCEREKWGEEVVGEASEDDGGEEGWQGRVGELLRSVLDEFRGVVRKMLGDIAVLQTGQETTKVQLELLLQRWEQIDIIVMLAITRLDAN